MSQRRVPTSLGVRPSIQNGSTLLPSRKPLEASAASWDACYVRGATPWQSSGLSEPTIRQLGSYVLGDRLLEVGCGKGPDRSDLIRLGFDYVGLDISKDATHALREGTTEGSCVCADFFKHSFAHRFDVVYDKGFFHGLAGVRRRATAVRRIASLLNPNGIWVTVCGSADHRRDDFQHGAIYLRDLVGPAEIYFEVLEIVKQPYGLLNSRHEFDAWYAAFRRR